MFVSPLALSTLLVPGEPFLQISVPSPGPVFWLQGLVSLALWVVALWLLVRVGRSCWSSLAERVRHDRRDRE